MMMMTYSTMVMAIILISIHWVALSKKKQQRGSNVPRTSSAAVIGTASDSVVPSDSSSSSSPYLEIGGFLARFGKGTEFERYSLAEVSSAVESLSRSEAAVKSMDGATHRLRNTFKESASLQLRFRKFMRSKRKQLKEASKILEYGGTVERALQAAEILQAVAVQDPRRRERSLREACLVEVTRFTVSLNSSRVACSVSVLAPMMEETKSNDKDKAPLNSSSSTTTTVPPPRVGSKAQRMQQRKAQSAPVRFLPGELVVAVTDSSSSEAASIARLLRLLSHEGEAVVTWQHHHHHHQQSLSGGLLSMQPGLLSLACEMIRGLKDWLPMLPSDSSSATALEEEVAAAGGGVTHHGKPNSSINSSSSSAEVEDASSREAAAASAPSSVACPPIRRLRIIGRSVGGAVGALAAVLLDGAMVTGDAAASVDASRNSRAKSARPNDVSDDDDDPSREHYTEVVASAAAELVNSADLRQWTGSLRGRVQCMAIGPPPCITRPSVPRYVTSIVCGDDVVPRAHLEAVRAFRVRVLKALKRGAGRSGGALGYLMGAGLLSDLSAVAGHSVAQYRDRKASSETMLLLPGRVFFVKARQLKQGATIQRVYRGNWQEDVLWRLRDILISKRMMEHHKLEAYIRALSRC